MKHILFAAALTLAAAAPASAQVWVGADPYYGAGVRVGPLGVGVGPGFVGEPYAYEPCHIERSRVVTAHGDVIYRKHRVCY